MLVYHVGIAVFFFFQAEDGIRDYKVTGVQTCALPISHSLTHSYNNQPRAMDDFCVSDATRLEGRAGCTHRGNEDRKSTRLNSSHLVISYAVFCLKKKTQTVLT